MKAILYPCGALALALSLLGGCKDRHEPVKPTVQPAAASAVR